MGLSSRLAGFVSPDGEKAYFFLADSYVRYDVAGDAADPGYPLKIADNWLGLFTEDIDAALCWPDGNVYFFKGDQYVKYDWASDKVADGYPLPIATMWPGVFGPTSTRPCGGPATSRTSLGTGSTSGMTSSRTRSTAHRYRLRRTGRDWSRPASTSHSSGPVAMRSSSTSAVSIPSTTSKPDGSPMATYSRSKESGRA